MKLTYGRQTPKSTLTHLIKIHLPLMNFLIFRNASEVSMNHKNLGHLNTRKHFCDVVVSQSSYSEIALSLLFS